MPKFSTAEELYNEFVKESGKFIEFSHNEWKTRISTWYIRYMLEHGAQIVDEDEHANLIRESIAFADYVIEKAHSELVCKVKSFECSLPVRISIVEEGQMPKKAHSSDAGFDCYARTIDFEENNVVSYKLGFKIEVPDGYAAFIFPRSSVYKKNLLLCNCVGIVDSSYRGEVCAKFRHSEGVRTEDIYSVGERVCQMVILPYPEISLIQTDKLSETDRGEGGFGSSGSK